MVAVGALPGLTVIADALPDPPALEIHAASATDEVMTRDPTRKTKRRRSLTV
jgi:hypothetical protein